MIEIIIEIHSSTIVGISTGKHLIVVEEYLIPFRFVEIEHHEHGWCLFPDRKDSQRCF